MHKRVDDPGPVEGGPQPAGQDWENRSGYDPLLDAAPPQEGDGSGGAGIAPPAFGDEGFWVGTAMDDLIVAGGGDDWLDGEAGEDVLHGGAGDDFIDAGQGADRIYGDAGDDVLIGGAGDDHLDGGQGDDQIDGGSGDDLLIGGAGCDIFNFDLAAPGATGADTISDFSRGEDLVWVTGDQASWSRLDSDDNGVLDAADAAVSISGGNLTLDLTGLQSDPAAPARITFIGVTSLGGSDLLLSEI